MGGHSFGPFKITTEANTANNQEVKAEELTLLDQSFRNEISRKEWLGCDKGNMDPRNPFFVFLNKKTGEFHCQFFVNQSSSVVMAQFKNDHPDDDNMIIFQVEFDFFPTTTIGITAKKGDIQEVDSYIGKLNDYLNKILNREYHDYFTASEEFKRFKEFILDPTVTNLDQILAANFSDLTSLHSKLKKQDQHFESYTDFDFCQDFINELQNLQNRMDEKNYKLIEGNVLNAKIFMLLKMGIYGETPNAINCARDYRDCLEKAAKLKNAPAHAPAPAPAPAPKKLNNNKAPHGITSKGITQFLAARAPESKEPTGEELYAQALKIRPEGDPKSFTKEQTIAYHGLLNQSALQGRCDSAKYQQGLDLINGDQTVTDNRTLKAVMINDYKKLLSKQCQEIEDALNTFESVVQDNYKNDKEVLKKLTKFMKKARKNITQSQYEYSKPQTVQYKEFAHLKIMELASKHFNISHQADAFICRLLGDILLAIAGLCTAGVAFRVKSKWTDSGAKTFLGGKSARQIAIDNEIKKVLKPPSR